MTAVLEGRNLVKSYRLARRGLQRRKALVAVDNVSIELRKGEFLGVVGESGSGKTTISNILAGLVTPDAGQVVFQGRAVDFRDRALRRNFRQNVQLVFQDPYSSLDPRMTIRQTIMEPLRSLQIAVDHTKRCEEVIAAVGLPPSVLDRYPHAFSGGQRQRIAIARALAPHPSVILADEPVSALDVSVQAQVLNLLLKLRSDFGLSIILISHDLAVVEQVADRVIVMQSGKAVEQGTPEEIFRNPGHPYTRRLLAALLDAEGNFPYADYTRDDSSTGHP